MQLDPSGFNPVTFLTQLGVTGIVSAVLLWLLIDERKERRATQAQLTAEQKANADMVERILPVLGHATTALERVQLGMEKQLERAERSAPSPEDMADALRRLERMQRELGDTLNERRRSL